MSVIVVSVLLTTYNRAALLREAIASVLCQDYSHLKLVVMDDASSDGTEQLMASYSDPRITYIRAKENTGQKTGDTPIVREFLDKHCGADLMVHLNDDDRWNSPTLLSRQVEAFRQNPSLAVVIGGVAQKYPHPIAPFEANAPYITNEFVGDDTVFAKGIYPEGLMTGREFIRLFAEDPPNRNIVCGAMMFDLSKVPLANYFLPGFGAQAGPAMVCGSAMHGDVFFIDEPLLLNRVERNCLSFKGTQAEHFRQCLASVDAAFAGVELDDDLRHSRERFIKGYFKAYLANKASWRLGAFRDNPLGDLSDVFDPPIHSHEFIDALISRGVPLTEDNLAAIALADETADTIAVRGIPEIWRLCA